VSLKSALSGYIEFAAANKRFVAFGFLITLASSFGQTYFIGIFGPALQEEFSLTHTQWGTIYMIGTLCSAAVLPFTGRYIDKLDLRHYTLLVCGLFIVACLFITLATSAWMLIPAIFLLRQSGQGLMSHVSVTSMARYFDAFRGRAIAVASLGFAVGEAIFPVAAVSAIVAFGWRSTYVGVAVFLGIVIVPLVLFLLVGHRERHDRWVRDETTSRKSTVGDAKGTWGVADVLRDSRFYFLLPGIMAPGVIVTALFFHHLNLADAKGWSHAWITGSYIIYSITTVATTLVTGPLIDRLGAMRLVGIMHAPLVVAMIIVAAFDSPWTVWVYLGIAGIHVGISHTSVPAMWAEVYGVTNIGAIKALATALMVLASALGPVIVGLFMDNGYSIEAACYFFAAFSAFGGILLFITLRRERTVA